MFLTIITFIIILTIIVFAHELGHFWTARKLGVTVEEFGFGFPPRLWSFIKKKTVYSINWIPLGGFVRIKGESGEDRDAEDSFASKAAWKKAAILSAGVIMNVVLAFIALSIGFMMGLPTVVDQETAGVSVSDRAVQIVSVEEGSVAQSIGLEMGDRIVSIDQQVFSSDQQIIEYIQNDQDRILSLVVNRFGEDLSLEADLTGQEQSILGVYLATTGLVKYPWYRAIWEGLRATGYVLVQIVMAFYLIIKGLFVGVGPGLQVAGPVGVAVLTGQMAQLGFAYLLQFTALLSLNLAIINILPFPALDGGRLVFVLIEKIRRKPNNTNIEAMIHNTGFILLLFLMFVVTYKDIARNSVRIMGALKGLIGL
ncbi:MAG: RIP metalloprotease RseP [Parcubacteria group bacterium CG1_02_37_51]|uniref:Zinc metalloprotease n=1 Tax=Candidatus Komeilibacteria bacterium CG_4_10_14_0_8_um_filter_37_78 TaxID=1974471 RepID=A0A2M7RG60_9BACT|nr:MAG: RIP metalloprotease RseP [Parcubacteria group bacterium CG1_02_37_51]PIY95336.1 MAG: RIP metalloprotease RseP [Candidatus Komeilibacteria bacterium CG_4_10_14_0_8_um_filter_37_78]